MDFPRAQMTETNPPLRLPKAREATIPPEKLKGYALNADHERGKNKARVFRSALGITHHDWEYLRDQILQRLPKAEVTRIEPRGSDRDYLVRVRVDGRNGASEYVATRWVVQPGQPPRLSTLWVDI
jgi:hypothetical protein